MVTVLFWCICARVARFFHAWHDPFSFEMTHEYQRTGRCVGVFKSFFVCGGSFIVCFSHFLCMLAYSCMTWFMHMNTRVVCAHVQIIFGVTRLTYIRHGSSTGCGCGFFSITFCMTWPIYTWHDSCIYLTWLMHTNAQGVCGRVSITFWKVLDLENPHVATSRRYLYDMSHSYLRWCPHMRNDLFMCPRTHSHVPAHRILKKKKKWVIYGANWLLSPNNMIWRTHPRLPQGRASLICLIHVWDDAFIRENTHSEVRWLVHAYLHVGFWNRKRASNLGSLLIVATAW